MTAEAAPDLAIGSGARQRSTNTIAGGNTRTRTRRTDVRSARESIIVIEMTNVDIAEAATKGLDPDDEDMKEGGEALRLASLHQVIDTIPSSSPFVPSISMRTRKTRPSPVLPMEGLATTSNSPGLPLTVTAALCNPSLFGM